MRPNVGGIKYQKGENVLQGASNGHSEIPQDDLGMAAGVSAGSSNGLRGCAFQPILVEPKHCFDHDAAIAARMGFHLGHECARLAEPCVCCRGFLLFPDQVLQ